MPYSCVAVAEQYQSWVPFRLVLPPRSYEHRSRSPSSLTSPCPDRHTIHGAVSPGVPLRLLGHRDARDRVCRACPRGRGRALDALIERMAYLMPVIELEHEPLLQELVGHLREKRRQLGLIRAMRAREIRRGQCRGAREDDRE